MKAYVFTKKGIIEPRELPEPKLEADSEADAGAAILRPLYLSPCSSDVHTVYAGAGPRREDMVLGHEGIAEVVSTGSAVHDFKPGDRVVVSAIMPDNGGVTGHEGTQFSGAKLGRNINGMWSELFKVPDIDANMTLYTDDVSPETALMAADMMATGYTAAEEAEISAGQTVAVIGSGAVGLMATAAAARKGARVLTIGTDKEINKRLAAGYGAAVYISYRDGTVLYDRDKKGGSRNVSTASEVSAAGGGGASGDRSRLSPADGSEFSDENQPMPYDSRANSTADKAVDTVLGITSGHGADRVLICGGGSDSLSKASDMLRYGTGIAVNVAYIEGTGFVGLPIFSLGRGMSGKTFKFELSRGGRKWTERMLSEARDGVDAGKMVTHHLNGFDSIPMALRMMKERPDGLIKIMVTV